MQLADPYRADMRRHRDLRNGDCRRGAVHGQDVVAVLELHRQGLADDLGLVVPALGEQRAQRPVDHPGSQGRPLAGSAFTPEEGAGDLPGCVMALLDVDRQGQEVDVTQVAGRRRAEHHRVAGTDYYGSARLAGELAGFEGDLLAANLHRDAAHVKQAHMCLFPPAIRLMANLAQNSRSLTATILQVPPGAPTAGERSFSEGSARAAIRRRPCRPTAPRRTPPASRRPQLGSRSRSRGGRARRPARSGARG